ncbi:MAG: AlwI family type II restriction endonuclease [Candidatus Kapabacteria bacterium]|nr:AlwI family type II restriction endonuclease [Candidatus Kapabacteria bacterium]
MKLWSISTTVRNPERLRNFLKVLSLLEGKPFNVSNQIIYQILLIQKKLYRPLEIPNKYQSYYENPEIEIPFEVAKDIFNIQGYVDPAMRGRQSVNPLNKLGFSIAREREGNIIITELGKQFISDDFDIGYIFFKSLLKLQFPNPWSKEFSKKFGFNVQPFIATMHLINNVNKNSEKKGLTKTEFSLFIPSLINFELIKDYEEKIIRYREQNNKKSFINEFAKLFYKTNDPNEKQINNFFEYGDNIMRYFRLTRYFKVSVENFGADWKIDLEPSRKVEIDHLIKTFSGASINFNTTGDYLNYISDISLPRLPFENLHSLKEIAKSLIKQINEFAKDINIIPELINSDILIKDFDKFSMQELKDYITQLRAFNLDLIDKQKRISFSVNFDKIQKIIDDLKNYKLIKKFAPEQFEKIITDALKIINDELKIKPNYSVDDNGEPIGHATGNKPDIECFYKNYNSIFEVTLDTSNYQWVRESQPVMRHLRDFESKYSKSTNYCVFISPKIHIDTLYHFWTSVKFGYDGFRQKIIPLTTEQFSVFLELLLNLIQTGKKFYHTDIELLYKEIIEMTDKVKGHTEWYSKIPKVIENWKKIILYED